MQAAVSWTPCSLHIAESTVVEILAEFGLEGLTTEPVRQRAEGAGVALPESLDLESLIVAALHSVEPLALPARTGCLRADLLALVHPWTGPRTQPQTESMIRALLSCAQHRPRVRTALQETLDRPIRLFLGACLRHAHRDHAVPLHAVQTLAWVIRALVVDWMWSPAPRCPVDLGGQVDFLLATIEAPVPSVHIVAPRTPMLLGQREVVR